MEIKSGTKTTEFWVAIAPVALGIFEFNKGDPDVAKYFIVCGTALGIAYIASRTFIKTRKPK